MKNRIVGDVKMRRNKYVIGIDPGKRGGIAAISLEDRKVVFTSKMPIVGEDYDYEKIDQIMSDNKDNIAMICIEKVGYMGRDTASSIASLCYHAGVLYGMAYSLNIPITVIAPSAWKKGIGLPAIGAKRGTKTETEEEKKIRQRENAKIKKKAKGNSISLAYELHPELRGRTDALTDGEAEAILIANYYIKLWYGENDEKRNRSTKNK